MDGPMECREFEKLVPDFIEKKLDYQTLKRFREHYDTCEECKEELAIQFLVTEGLNRLEEGSAFDLQHELNRQLEDTRKIINTNKVILHVGLVLELAAMVLVSLGVMWIILN